MTNDAACIAEVNSAFAGMLRYKYPKSRAHDTESCVVNVYEFSHRGSDHEADEAEQSEVMKLTLEHMFVWVGKVPGHSLPALVDQGMRMLRHVRGECFRVLPLKGNDTTEFKVTGYVKVALAVLGRFAFLRNKMMAGDDSAEEQEEKPQDEMYAVAAQITHDLYTRNGHEVTDLARVTMLCIPYTFDLVDDASSRQQHYRLMYKTTFVDSFVELLNSGTTEDTRANIEVVRKALIEKKFSSCDKDFNRTVATDAVVAMVFGTISGRFNA